MTDTQAIVDAMGALSDDELRAVVAAATTGRPDLTALRAAALQIGIVPGPAPAVPGPAVPPPAEILDAHVVDEPGVVAAPGVSESVTGWTDAGVPTFDAVRERIETRAGTADGASELDAASATGRSVEEQFAAREKAAQERLAEIRKSLRRD
ncbi:hypothetical protein [Rhodococcus triatomae]